MYATCLRKANQSKTWGFEKVSKVVSLLYKAGAGGIGYRNTRLFLCSCKQLSNNFFKSP